jgi:hypothetical protein
MIEGLLNDARRLDSKRGFLSGNAINDDVLTGMKQGELLKPNVGILEGLGRPLEDWLTGFDDAKDVKRPRHVGRMNSTTEINLS